MGWWKEGGGGVRGMSSRNGSCTAQHSSPPPRQPSCLAQGRQSHRQSHMQSYRQSDRNARACPPANVEAAQLLELLHHRHPQRRLEHVDQHRLLRGAQVHAVRLLQVEGRGGRGSRGAEGEGLRCVSVGPGLQANADNSAPSQAAEQALSVASSRRSACHVRSNTQASAPHIYLDAGGEGVDDRHAVQRRRSARVVLHRKLQARWGWQTVWGWQASGMSVAHLSTQVPVRVFRRAGWLCKPLASPAAPAAASSSILSMDA